MQAYKLLILLNIVITTIILFSILTVAAIIYDPSVVGLSKKEIPNQIAEESVVSSPVLSSALLEGKQLFKLNCRACHNANMKDDMTGPALAGVQDRWSDYPKEDLYQWIRNSQKMVGKVILKQ